MPESNLITVYRSRPFPGEFFSTAYFDADTPVDYPFTTNPVPDELKDKVVRFNWDTLKWVDISDDASLQKMMDLESQNAALALALATAQTAASEAKTAAEQAKSAADAGQEQVAALTLQLAQALAALNNKEGK